MAHIELVDESAAEGLLARHYQAATKRAGRVFNIVKTMSPNPRVLQASMALYMEVMKGESPLSRAQREMVAVVVSQSNDCFY